MKEIEKNIQQEVKEIIKEQFNYEIPIAKVEKAGITTTGGECENELEEVLEEFKIYNKEMGLWKRKTTKYDYLLDENLQITKKLQIVD